MISSICILYYHDDERFDKHGSKVILSKDKRTVTKNSMGFDDITFGKYEIPSKSNSIFQWQFKIRKMADIVIIGIVSLKYQQEEEDGIRYTVWSDGDLYKYGGPVGSNRNIAYKQGDRVSIVLDPSKAHIKASVNDGEEYIIFRNIISRDDVKYIIMISFGQRAGSCVEMQRFFKL